MRRMSSRSGTLHIARCLRAIMMMMMIVIVSYLTSVTNYHNSSSEDLNINIWKFC